MSNTELFKEDKEVIDKISDKEWFFLAKRSNAPPIPLWEKMMAMGSPLMGKIYGVRLPTFSIWEGKWPSIPQIFTSQTQGPQ